MTRAPSRLYQNVIGLAPVSQDAGTVRLGVGDTVLLALRQDPAARPRASRAVGPFHNLDPSCDRLRWPSPIAAQVRSLGSGRPTRAVKAWDQVLEHTYKIVSLRIIWQAPRWGAIGSLRRAGESRCEPAAEGATAPETLRHPDRSFVRNSGKRSSRSRRWCKPTPSTRPGETLRPMTEGARVRGARSNLGGLRDETPIA